MPEQPIRPSRQPLYALLLANTISQVGNMMTTVAIPWFVLQTTGSALQVGISSFVNTAPLFLAAFLGGSLIDRFGSKRMSIIADIMSGLTVAAIPLLFGLNVLSYPVLLILIFLGAILDAPGTTARHSLLPDVIEQARVKPERANAAYQAVFRFSILFGPLLGGLLTARYAATDVLWIDAMTFLVSALLIARFAPRIMSQATDHPPVSMRDNLVGGLRFLWQDVPMMAMLILVSLVDLVANALLGVVVPVYAEHVFGSAADFGGMLAAFGGGMLVGTILYGAVGHRFPRYPTLVVGMLGATLPSLGLIALPSLPVAVVLLAVMGLFLAPVSVLTANVFQERTPAHLRGRVFGARFAVQTASLPIGMLVTGALIEGAGLVPALIILTGGYSLVGISVFFIPGLRKMAVASPLSETHSTPEAALDADSIIAPVTDN
ncbi:MAG: MFS transporter [Anaerolineae bacterium]